MKKALLSLASLLVAALVVVSATSWLLPNPDKFTASVSGRDDITYVVENGPVFCQIYGIDSSGTLRSLYREASQWGQRRITQLAWKDGYLYYLRETTGTSPVWEVVMLDDENLPVSQGSMAASGYRATHLCAPSYVTGVTSDGSGGAAVYDCANQGSAVLIQSAPEQGAILHASYLPDEDALLCLLDDGQTAKLSRTGVYPVDDAQETSLPDSVTVPFGYRLACKAPLLIVTACGILVLGLLIILVVLLCARSKRLAVRITAVSTGCLLLAVSVMAGVLLGQTTNTRLNDRLLETARSAQRTAATLSTLSPSSTLGSSFYGSEVRQLYTGLLSNGVEGELLALKDDTLTVAVSASRPYGQPVSQAYSPQLAALVQQAAEGQSPYAIINTPDSQIAVAAQPLLSNGVLIGVVVVRTQTSDIIAASLHTLSTLAITGLVVVLAACLLLALLLWRFTRPLGQLTRQMEAISDGDVKVRDIRTGLDELGEMARAMQEMCMGLSIREYEVQSTIHSYNRFVPRGLADLLERASIMEVSFGDVRSIPGNVGILSVSNRDAARNRLEDGPFVDFVNDCFGAVYRNVAEHGGYLLSSGFDLGSVKIYYQGKASSAVDSGLNLLGERQGSQSATGISPEFFFILHRTTFLYGIAGTKDEVFPFLSSQEMEFLGGYSQRFAAAGARVILTDSFFQELDSGFAVRYIGFITNPENGVSHKLYEVLDAYPELERNLRIRYDERLQEAIQLFYRSDFYLARNLFSTLLRACPGDGIARWYLFACEHFFNAAAAGEEPDFQLFGIDEH